MTNAELALVDAECRRRGWDAEKLCGLAVILPNLRFYRFYRRAGHTGLQYEIVGKWTPRQTSKVYDLEIV